MIELSETTKYEVHRRLKDACWGLVLMPFDTLSVAQKAYKDQVKYNPKNIYRVVEVVTVKQVIEAEEESV